MSSLFENMWPAFYAEVSEQLDELELQLVSADTAREDVAQTFRLFHTIKSSAAMMEFTAMEQLAHVAEDMLDLVRNNKAVLDEPLCDLLSTIAGRLKQQLQEADQLKAAPAADPELWHRARTFLAALGGEAEANTATAEPVVDHAAPAEDNSAFVRFAEASEAALPGLAGWLAGKARSAPRALKVLAAAARDANLLAIAELLDRAGTEAVPQRWWTLADALHRLNSVRAIADQHFGVPALAAGLRPLLLEALRSRADSLQVSLLDEQHPDFRQLAGIAAEMTALCWLFDYRSLALLQGFVRQMLLEASRGNVAVQDALREMLLIAVSLATEVDVEQAEDAAFSDICGRTLASLQSLVQRVAEGEENEQVRKALVEEFDLPYSLIASLHAGALHDLLGACRQAQPLLDIEVDMDGPDRERDGFLAVIKEHGQLISNRTVFTSDAPGDRHAEGTRLSIIASCPGDTDAMRTRLQAFHSAHFHLSVTDIPYRHQSVSPSADVGDVQPESDTAGVAEPAAPAAQGVSLGGDTIRVSSDGLDRFVTRVGELVLLRNRIEHVLRGDDTEKLVMQIEAASRQLARHEELAPEALVALAQQLEDLLGQFDRLRDADAALQQSLGQLQGDALSLRVVPVDVVFRRMPVLVKQLSRQLGKPVELHIAGADTRIDKSMVDILSEPLIHMVRNALDHGIETPEQRRVAGKSATAHLQLRASNQAGMLQIELSDDGRGLDDQRILQRAMARNLVTAEQAAAMPLADIQRLIFEPGFSTSEAITETSGRGVGMDVVKTRMEQLGGSVSVRSVAGRGCQITLTMPVSAAIQGIVLFRQQDRVYGLPERNLAEILSVSMDQLQAVQGQVVMLHRGRSLPLYTLPHLFGESATARAVQQCPVLLITDGHRRIGLMVDELEGRQEIFVRDCHPDIRRLPGVSGASILGNGQPLLILDAAGLIQLGVERAQSLAALMEAS